MTGGREGKETKGRTKIYCSTLVPFLCFSLLSHHKNHEISLSHRNHPSKEKAEQIPSSSREDWKVENEWERDRQLESENLRAEEKTWILVHIHFRWAEILLRLPSLIWFFLAGHVVLLPSLFFFLGNRRREWQIGSRGRLTSVIALFCWWCGRVESYFVPLWVEAVFVSQGVKRRNKEKSWKGRKERQVSNDDWHLTLSEKQWAHILPKENQANPFSIFP